MPRAKKNTVQLVCRVDFNIISKLKSINPSLVTKDASSGDIKFRHGALGKYIQRLITDDLAKRGKRIDEEPPEDILERFRT